MEPRRVLLLGMPRLLRDLVREIVAHEPDLELVGEVETPPADVEADFVIVGVPDPVGADDVLALLELRPLVKVLALSGDGRDAVLWELRPHRAPLGEMSPATLLDAIRAPDWRHAGVG